MTGSSAIEPAESRNKLRVLRRALPLLCLLYVLYFFAAFRAPGISLFERDGYFHARLANLLPELGLSRHFPWTQGSIWKDHYCDKDFLYHVAMVPFARNSAEPLLGVTYFAILLTACVFIVMYLVLRAQRVPFPELFAISMFCISGDFLIRMEMIRSHVLSVSLAIAGIHFLVNRRWKALAVLGFIYAWCYSFPMVLVMCAVPFAVGCRLSGGSIDWKSPLASFLGVVAGLLIHPYSPNTIATFVTLIHVGFNAVHSNTGSMEVAGEFGFFSAGESLTRLPVFHLAWIFALISAWRFRKIMTPEFFGALVTALFWYAMSMRFVRFFEYAVPFLVIVYALGARDILAGTERKFNRGALLGAGTAAVLIAAHIHSIYIARTERKFAEPPHFRGACAWLAKHTEPGETVVDLWWHDFPDLFYDGHRQHYVWGIEPTYTQRFDSQIAEKLENMRKGVIPVDTQWLSNTFNARYLILQNWSEWMVHPDLQTHKWNPVYVDNHALIFALTGPDGPPQSP